MLSWTRGSFNDTELTWQAKGLLTYMLSSPNDWEFNMKDLQKRSQNGRDATYRIMKELIEAGYVTRVENRDGGKFGKAEYIVHEMKQSPHTGNPYPENPPLLNNKEKVVVEDVYQFYQQNFGVLPPAIGEDIAYWIDDLSEELVIQAMKEALEQSKRTWKYVKAILRDWAQKGVKSLDDIRALETEWKKRKGGWQHAINRPSTLTPGETESDVREAIERRKRIAESTLYSEDNSPFLINVLLANATFRDGYGTKIGLNGTSQKKMNGKKNVNATKN
jgi:DnaD/phage-associated family protein